MQKFIVTSEGRLKFGDVALHKHLLSPYETCVGGGVYEFEWLEMKMLLSGKSYDFGRVKWDYVDRLIIPASLRGVRILYEGLPIENFVYVRYE